MDRYAGIVRDSAADDHLADVEQLMLAAEAARIVFPPAVAALAGRFRDAGQELSYVGITERPQADEASPGDSYSSARDEFTGEARRLIAPVPYGRIRAALELRRHS